MTDDSPASSDPFASAYAASAVAAFVLTFATLYEKNSSNGVTVSYGNLWQETGQSGLAVLGVLLMLSLVGLLLSVSFVPVRSGVRPSVIAVLAGTGLLMLATKAGTNSPAPDFAAGGQMLLGLTILLVALAIAHLGRTLAGHR